MYKLYRKNPENFALAWIGIYCLVQSLANGISARIGIPKAANAVLALIQSAYMLWWLYQNGIMKDFCLNRPTQSAKHLLFYVPLILVSTSNLWLGVRMNLPPAELAFHILLMLCVGFLEELIFRGFLFEALRKKSMMAAVIVTSLTFGVGHFINLFNGSGMALGEVLFQIAFAVLIGFLFVMVYLRSGSLLPSILSHQTINILSAFTNHQAAEKCHLTANLIEMAIILLYLVWMIKAAPAEEDAQ